AAARRPVLTPFQRAARSRTCFSVCDGEATAGSVIIDLKKFSAAERPAWQELERFLNRLDGDPAGRLTLEEARRLHYLYERTSADLAKLVTFSVEPELRRYLESLVARAYTEIHETRSSRPGVSAWNWFLHTVPQTFR